MSTRGLARSGALTLASMSLVACALTAVQPGTETTASRLPRPQRILVYDFAISEADVRENQGVVQQTINQESGTTQDERERQIGRDVADATADHLARGLRDLGFATERARRGTRVAGSEVLIDGRFVDVDEGNRARRLVIGFGAGASRVDTLVEAFQGADRLKLLEFTTHSDSGMMPGAAVTMGAGAAAEGGVTAGMAAANVAASGFKAYRSEVERMAARNADQAVAYLSQFFAKHGWIRPDQVKPAVVVE